MNLLQSFLLGILQGLTEFIPVSSTAHLLIAEHFLGLEANEAAFAFTVLVQLGTIVSLIVYFWADLWGILRAVVIGIWQRKPFADEQARLGWLLLLATFPALLAGVMFKPLVDALFKAPLVEATIRLGFTVILLLAAEYWSHRNRKLNSINWKDALWIGLAQVLAVFPGASRSGTTISAGMAHNLERPAAARFAFLMSVPVMLAAGGYEMLNLLRHQQMAASLLPNIVVGIVTAAVVGFLAIRWLLNFLGRRPLYSFAIYCGALGLFTLVLALIGK